MKEDKARKEQRQKERKEGVREKENERDQMQKDHL